MGVLPRFRGCARADRNAARGGVSPFSRLCLALTPRGGVRLRRVSFRYPRSCCSIAAPSYPLARLTACGTPHSCMGARATPMHSRRSLSSPTPCGAGTRVSPARGEMMNFLETPHRTPRALEGARKAPRVSSKGKKRDFSRPPCIAVLFCPRPRTNARRAVAPCRTVPPFSR